MIDLTNCEDLYNKLKEHHPDWLGLFNNSLSEAYDAGEMNGYNTSDGYPSGVFSVVGYLRRVDDYQLLFPDSQEESKKISNEDQYIIVQTEGNIIYSGFLLERYDGVVVLEKAREWADFSLKAHTYNDFLTSLDKAVEKLAENGVTSTSKIGPETGIVRLCNPVKIIQCTKMSQMSIEAAGEENKLSVK